MAPLSARRKRNASCVASKSPACKVSRTAELVREAMRKHTNEEDPESREVPYTSHVPRKTPKKHSKKTQKKHSKKAKKAPKEQTPEKPASDVAGYPYVEPVCDDEKYDAVTITDTSDQEYEYDEDDFIYVGTLEEERVEGEYQRNKEAHKTCKGCADCDETVVPTNPTSFKDFKDELADIRKAYTQVKEKSLDDLRKLAEQNTMLRQQLKEQQQQTSRNSPPKTIEPAVPLAFAVSTRNPMDDIHKLAMPSFDFENSMDKVHKMNLEVGQRNEQLRQEQTPRFNQFTEKIAFMNPPKTIEPRVPYVNEGTQKNDMQQKYGQVRQKLCVAQGLLEKQTLTRKLEELKQTILTRNKLLQEDSVAAAALNKKMQEMSLEALHACENLRELGLRLLNNK